MANNYIQFSAMIPAARDERAWLIQQLNAGDPDYGFVCLFEERTEPGGVGIWVWADEYADLQRLVEIVCEFQRHFNEQHTWSLTWADTCSKPRLDEFGGGAVVCFKGEDHWLNTSQWVEEKEKELVSG